MTKERREMTQVLYFLGMLVSVRGNSEVTAVNVEVVPNLNRLLAMIVVVDSLVPVLNTKPKKP
jgi:hypothetical protein